MQNLGEALEGVRSTAGEKERLEVVRQQEQQLCPELKSNDIYASQNALMNTVQTQCHQFFATNESQVDEMSRIFLCIERCYVRATTCEREVIIPQIRKVSADAKTDQSHELTADLLQAELDYFDVIFRTLQGRFNKGGYVTTVGFRNAIRAFQESYNIHQERLKALFPDVKPYTTADENHTLMEKMKQIYCNVPREAFTPFGSITNKLSTALHRVSGALASVTAPVKAKLTGTSSTNQPSGDLTKSDNQNQPMTDIDVKAAKTELDPTINPVGPKKMGEDKGPTMGKDVYTAQRPTHPNL